MEITGPKGTSGSGWFSSSDRAVWDLSPAAESDARRHGFLMRAPLTDAEVLLADEDGKEREPVPGPTKLSGPWNVRGQEISSTTGEVVRERELTCDIEVRGPRLRISFTDGSYDQGVFVAPDLFWFHVVHPPVAPVEPGPAGVMATTRNHDILGFVSSP